MYVCASSWSWRVNLAFRLGTVGSRDPLKALQVVTPNDILASVSQFDHDVSSNSLHETYVRTPRMLNWSFKHEQ